MSRPYSVHSTALIVSDKDIISMQCTWLERRGMEEVDDLQQTLHDK